MADRQKSIEIVVDARTGKAQARLQKLDRQAQSVGKSGAGLGRQMKAGLGQIPAAAAPASKAIGDGLTQASTKANTALLDLSRIIEDAPYGFRGIANNIPQAQLSLGRLGAAAGGAGGAIKAMMASIAGPAGILLGISLLTSAIVTFGPKLRSIFTKDDTDRVKAWRNALNSADRDIEEVYIETLELLGFTLTEIERGLVANELATKEVQLAEAELNEQRAKGLGSVAYLKAAADAKELRREVQGLQADLQHLDAIIAQEQLQDIIRNREEGIAATVEQGEERSRRAIQKTLDYRSRQTEFAGAGLIQLETYLQQNLVQLHESTGSQEVQIAEQATSAIGGLFRGLATSQIDSIGDVLQFTLSAITQMIQQYIALAAAQKAAAAGTATAGLGLGVLGLGVGLAGGLLGGLFRRGRRAGGTNLAGGIYRVHQDEYVHVPRGTNIVSQAQSVQIAKQAASGGMGGGRVSVGIALESDIDMVVRRVTQQVETNMRTGVGEVIVQ